MPEWLEKVLPIFILLAVVATVLARLPKVEGVDHSADFRRRRVLNWLPLGLTYAFLYMGRYNLKVSKLAFGEMPGPTGEPMMGNDDFGYIFAAGTVTYGFAFLLNGPLTDRFGGRKAMLVGAGGSALMNGLMGVATWLLVSRGPGFEFIGNNFVLVFSALYALNMYFQAFGAVAVVKVNAPWFHVRERGVFGAIFGILISLGIYFAFDWGNLIQENLDLQWVFWIPTLILALLWVVDFSIVRNSPGEAGLLDFDLGDGQSIHDDTPAATSTVLFGTTYSHPFVVELARIRDVFIKMLSNPVILTIALIEFCSGFLRQAIMQWYREFAKQTDSMLHLKDSFVYDNWGLLLCCAGILGGVVAGIISDHVFQSRRGPVAALLYAVMFVSSIALTFTYTTEYVGWLVVFMSMAVIGVHGMLSGTASMDFGGKKNVGVAVGIIDGFVYLGTAVMSLTYAIVLPKAELDAEGHIVGAAADPANWLAWPAAMIPLALMGMLLATRVWNAKPGGDKPKSTDKPQQTTATDTA